MHHTERNEVLDRGTPNPLARAQSLHGPLHRIGLRRILSQARIPTLTVSRGQLEIEHRRPRRGSRGPPERSGASGTNEVPRDLSDASISLLHGNAGARREPTGTDWSRRYPVRVRVSPSRVFLQITRFLDFRAALAGLGVGAFRGLVAYSGA